MKKYLSPVIIFLSVFWIYFGISTGWSFKPKWALDYYNPIAKSLMQGRLDIVDPPITYDLVHFGEKWYAPWGVLPALFFVPLQLLKGRFIPPLYITLFFASADVVVFYLILRRVKSEFFPWFTGASLWLVLALFAFGTTHAYVGTLGSVWHVGQMVTNLFGTLGLYFIFKKKRRPKDYLLSALSFGVALLGRATIVVLASIPAFFYIWDYVSPNAVSWQQKQRAILRGIVLFGVPLGIFIFFFLSYNWLRFGSPFEYGYRFIREAPYLAEIRERNGIMSLKNLPTNLWYILLEAPRFRWENGVKFDFDLKGNSIFLLTPPLFAIFLARPWIKKGRKFTIEPHVSALWLGAIITMMPSLVHYGTGWMQFGYRYSLDITAILVLLSVFGMKGKLNWIYVAGIIISIFFYVYGIRALQ